MPVRPAAPRPPIAVVGVSALFPGSQDNSGFWRDILAGRDLITDVPPSHWLIEDYYDPDMTKPGKTYAHRGAFLDAVDFDAMGFGVPPNIVPATDTSQLLALIVARKVLDDACAGQFESADKDRISCILGVTSAQELLGSMVSSLQRPVWQKSLRDAGLPESKVQEACDRIYSHYTPWVESTFPGLLGNVVAGRIANRLNLGGTNCVTDAACASAFSAVSMAVNELYLGDSDLVICGGVDTMNDIFMYMCFSKTPALSKSGDCRPFSDKADGTLLGEGMAMFALKRLDDAERDGDRVYAVLTGVGASSDGKAKSVYAPVPEGQAKALSRAYARAGYGADTVELLEAHGTGTKAGDAAEFEGLRLAFDASGRQDRQWCALGSVKSQIGHTKAAAGAAGMFKAVMALAHKRLPPTIKVDRPNPKLELEKSPFYLNTRTRPWIRGPEHPRRASVSSFGFGGSNFHVAMEEYTGPGKRAERLRTQETELLLLSAASPEALAAAATGLKLDAPGTLQRRAWELAGSFDASAPCRLAVVAKDEADARAKLSAAAARLPSGPFSTPDGVAYGQGAKSGKVAFLYPGQGSQLVEMGGEVAGLLDVAIRPWDVAAGVHMGAERLHDVVFPRPVFTDEDRAAQQDKLTRTEWAQPALGATSLALAEVLRALGVSPDMAAGHSFGELCALWTAGSLSTEALLRAARRRGELMAEAAARPGAMSAVSASVEQVKAALAAHPDVVLANHNSPSQIVISGPTDAVEAAERALGAAGLSFKRLKVATAFHSPVVADAVGPFGAFLAELEVHAPSLPVYANATAAPYAADAAEVRQGLASQLASPVRFVEQIVAMSDAGAAIFVEVGPQAVLTGLVDSILGERPHLAVALDRKGKNGWTTLISGLGRLAAAGVSLDARALWAGYGEPIDPASVKRAALTLPINGSNLGKPYPPVNGAAGLPGPNPEPAPLVPEVIVKEVIKEVVREVPVEVPAQHAAAPAAQAAPGGVETLAWLAAFQDMQARTADAQQAFQQSMAQAQVAFLSTVQTSFAGLNQLVGAAPRLNAAPVAYTPPAVSYAPPPVWSHPQPAPAPVVSAPVAAPAPVVSAPVAAPAPVVSAPVVAPVAAAPVIAPAPVVAPAPVAAPVAAAPAPKASSSVDVESLLMAVVAEKTGYPSEMLNLDMGLESDLGIDSIKRVEILSAMRTKAPSLPEVDAGAMANLRTLGQIVGYLREQLGGSAAAAPAAPAAAAPVAPKAASSSVDVESLLMAVVAEKTGYPSEMLNLDMGLESDLGIDSIKRVEILSAMRTKAPSLPEVDAGAMASLRTLGQIVGYLREQLGGSAASAPAASASAAPKAASSSVDVEALLMSVVAEKTGYPAEMLNLDMGLESDLGIDSIKRVEILSAMRTKAPSLPEVDAGAMASLRTLGQIVGYLREQLGGPSDDPNGGGGGGGKPTSGDAADAKGGESADPRLGRYATKAVARPGPGFSVSGLAGEGSLLLTPDGRGVAHALAARLQARGLAVVVSNELPADAKGAVLLHGLGPFADEDAALAAQVQAFQIARGLAPRLSARGGVFVTTQDTGADFGLSCSDLTRALSGGLVGLSRTAGIEWSQAGVKGLDVEVGERGADAVAEAIERELLTGGPDRDVGLAADGRRLVLESVAARAIQPGPARVDASSVIVATGGARGVTAACLIALAKRARCAFALLGRTALEDEPAALAGVEGEANLKRALLAAAAAAGEKVSPALINSRLSKILANREVRATLSALAAAGSRAIYIAADVNDPARLGAALGEVRRSLGPITGLVHGAGVIADKLIAEKTDDQFQRVFDTKVAGLRALLAATANDPLTMVCLFSSVAGRCGNAGQCDYAMANQTLNSVALAESRRRPGVLWKSLGWGPWEGGMVTPALKARFEAAGVPLIPLDGGAELFAREVVAGAADQVDVVMGGAPRAEALLPTEAPTERRYDVHVSAASHPYLQDHSIQGVPVVPVVLALEWFARAAQMSAPELTFVGCRGVKVLKGVRLADFQRGEWLTVVTRKLHNGDGAVLAVELRGASGVVHYRGEAVMASGYPAPSAPSGLSRTLDAWPHALYGDVLFHGPDFQVIRGLDGVSDAGTRASVAGVSAQGWGAEGWVTDAAALDGGLQLALLWSRRVLGGRSLPTSFGEYKSYMDGAPEGLMQVELSRRVVERSRAVSDIRLTDAAGRLVAELTGVETHLLPS